jgi:hypothetical protein
MTAVAQQQLELVIGHDRIVRINVDGICVIRIRVCKACAFDIRNDIVEYVASLRAAADASAKDSQ